MDAPLVTGPKQLLKPGQILGCGDDQNVSNSGQHQSGDRVVDHRLVVDGQQLLADDARERVEARPRAACEHDSLHGLVLEERAAAARSMGAPTYTTPAAAFQ